MMADRVLSVRLQMEVDGARRSSKALAKDMVGFAQSAEAGGRAADGAMSRIRTGAMSAGKAVATVGGIAAGGLATLTAATVKGGVAYNNLEQTSRAALKTVLGSASAASGQMEKLREFGKTSPFPRQVWISAQQQLLAFGMSAEKIIPTFQAIQDAVAAAGGGSQQISEITQIIAKIQSTGKVTADELNELGFRGIDAATLIGEAMGKTAAEVREDITAQAITGVQFIDQLTAAMSTRFGGAAAGVKETWAGATDRIKGAVRDVGSVLATPLVDPNGGGAAVEWANSIADALRALESRLIPVMGAIRDRAEPAVEALNEKLQALAEWIRTADFSRIASQIKPMLPAILGVSAGLTTMALGNIPYVDKLVGSLKPLPVALLTAAMASPELRQALFDLLAAATPLLVATGDIAKVLTAALGPALQLVAVLLQPVIAVVQALGNILGALPGPIQMVIAGFVAWKALGVGQWLLQTIAPLRTFNDQMKVHAALAEQGGQKVGAFGSALSVAQTRINNAGSAISRMRASLGNAVSFLGGPWGVAIGAATIGLGLLAGANSAAAQAEADHQQQVDSMADALRATKGAIDEQVAALALKRLEEKEAVGLARELGIPIKTLTDAYLGNKDALADVQRQLQSYLDEVKGQGQLEGQVAGSNPLADKAYDLKRILEELSPEMAEARQGVYDYNSATGAASSGSNMLAAAINNVGDAADSVATRTQQLKASLDSIYNAQFALTEAQDGFQGSLHKISGAFAGNEKAASKSAGSAEKAAKRSAAAADKYADSLKRQQQIIRDTQKQLQELAESQREAEREAAEAAKAARQRALDALFGQTFDRQTTMDAFTAGLKDAAAAISDAKKEKIVGAQSLTGDTEGALANRDRLRQLTQQAQAVLQAEKDAGASPERLRQVSKQLSAQLAQQATAWGLNATEVKQYTDAIAAFGQLASSKVIVDLKAVRKEFAEQRAEIKENRQEQLESAKESAKQSSDYADQAVATAAATKIHTAALKGNSESAIENRAMMQAAVKAAQDELTQMALNGASKEALTKRGKELAAQLEQEAIKMGFAKRDLGVYTNAIRDSAVVVAQYPQLNVRAETAGALTTIANFVTGVNRQLAKIQDKIKIGALTGSEYINSIGGGRQYLADGGFVTGPGGPRDDRIPAMLSNREFVVNAADTARNRDTLEYINSGGVVPRQFAKGGYVAPTVVEITKPSKAGLKIFGDAILGGMQSQLAMTGPLGWAASQAGKPYIWASVGPAGYDCSGFMSAITNVIQRKPVHVRRFATGSFPTGDFSKGPGNFMIGSRRGNPGHMAGTLMGVNVESRGGDGVVIGKSARGARDSLFGGNIWHLKGYRDGGMVSGDPPFDLISPLGKHFEDMVKGSYERGTSYVPMDGLYRLHRGEAVIPRDLNRALVDALQSGKLGGTHNENHIEVRSYSDRYDHRQVMDDLAARGVA